MEYQGEVYISPKYKKKDYLELNLAIESDSVQWKKAVEMFSDRINGRFFKQIDLLLTDIKNNSFAIMALNCLLVETLSQFKEGIAGTDGNNKKAYTQFLQKEFFTEFDSVSKAELFYSNIRCGILHSAQTKGKTRLSDQESYVIDLKNGVLSVSVLSFSKLLKEYFEQYKEKLKDSIQYDLRKNFIAKMKYVCRK